MPFGGGAGLVTGGRAVVLLDEAPARGLGGALAWASRAGARSVEVLADTDAGLLARRAAAFAGIDVTVRWVQGRDTHEVAPSPLEPPAVVPDEALALAPTLAEAGCAVVVEHGEVGGEVLGLEVAKVVDGGIEVGIGRHDREAFALVHGNRPTAPALSDVVTAVRANRRADAPDQPLYRLAQERWLREQVLADPGVVGVEALERHEGPLPGPNVRDPWPAVAVSFDRSTVVVCSVGIDLDLVPYAADARLAAGAADARLVLVLPERDAHPVTRNLAAALAVPAEVVTVPDTWRVALS